MKTLHVVAAIIIKDDKILCCQRENKGPLALKWEFPGGKIEKDETKVNALKREIKEELNLDINVIKFFSQVAHQYPTFHIIMDSFICHIHHGILKLNEHVDYKWLTINELMSLDWAEADIPLVEKLIKVKKQEEMHEKLNGLYRHAQMIYEDLSHMKVFTVSVHEYKNNYINIHGKQLLQHYPIPVITIEDMGDIGFNLDGQWFEFFVKKEEFQVVDLEKLINQYNVEIYSGSNCLVDFYKPGYNSLKVRELVLNSLEETIGITVYYLDGDLIESFFNVCNLLKSNKS